MRCLRKIGQSWKYYKRNSRSATYSWIVWLKWQDYSLHTVLFEPCNILKQAGSVMPALRHVCALKSVGNIWAVSACFRPNHCGGAARRRENCRDLSTGLDSRNIWALNIAAVLAQRLWVQQITSCFRTRLQEKSCRPKGRCEIQSLAPHQQCFPGIPGSLSCHCSASLWNAWESNEIIRGKNRTLMYVCWNHGLNSSSVWT